ncbi:MAG: hypothetical protein ACREJB_05310 [Planctomycetaceae bacterium]
MTTIELTADIGPDRRLVVELPPQVPIGRRHVLLIIDDVRQETATKEDATPEQGANEPPLRWDGTLLVYDGEIAAADENLLDEIREQRIRSFFPGVSHESPD